MSQTKVQLIKDGALAEDSIVHDGDTNTKIRFSGADTITAETGGSERVRVDSSGNFSIGSTSNVAPLNVKAETDGNLHVRPIGSIASAPAGSGIGLDVLNDAGSAVKDLALRGSTTIFRNASAESMRIDSSGKVGIGTSSPTGKFAVSDGTVVAEINPFTASNGAFIGTRSNHAVLFKTNATERMRIDTSGHVIIGSTSADSNNSDGIRLFNFGSVHATRTNEFSFVARRSSSDGGIVLFRRDSTDVGNISVTTSATSYNSGSDYRLKQDDTPLINGLTRLKQLKPIQFKWKNDTSKFVDGFFAHEVSPVVPESITGKKDAVYEEDDDLGHKKGDPIYQQIDQSKLVPLLTAALQEEIAKREALETRVATLEAA